MIETADPPAICTILGYHEISPTQPGMRGRYVVSPEAFEAQLSYLRAAGGACLALDDLPAALAGTMTVPPRSFVITMDDGYIGVHDHALPLLQRFVYTATVFVPSLLIGEEGDVNDTPPVAKMNEDQLRDLMAAGISIGAHTRTHADLREISGRELWDEIYLSRLDLEEQLGHSIRTFCYPYGRYNDEAVRAVKESGYSVACTTRHGWVDRRHDPCLLPRVMIREDACLPDLLQWEG